MTAGFVFDSSWWDLCRGRQLGAERGNKKKDSQRKITSAVAHNGRNTAAAEWTNGFPSTETKRITSFLIFSRRDEQTVSFLSNCGVLLK